MTAISAQTRIDASVAEVWNAMADFGGVWRYSPGVTKSHSLTESNSGVGAERHCDLTFAGASVDERIVEWVDNDHYAIEIFEGEKMPPIKNMRAVLSVRKDGDETIASGTMSYEPKGLVGAVMDRVMIRRNFSKAWTGIFAGLKHHIETGQLVEGGSGLPYEDVELISA